MERTDYAKRFRGIKNEILEEIRELLPEDSAHNFSEKFYVHYIDGEVATTEICSAVEVWFGGKVAFIVNRETTAKEEVIEEEKVFNYTSDSFLDILDHLKKELRDKKLKTIIDIVTKNGGKIDFHGEKEFFIQRETEIDRCRLDRLYIDNGGELIIENTFNGELYADDSASLDLDEIERVLSFARELTQKVYKVRAFETFSRTFEIRADSYEDAVEAAKKELKSFPFSKEDSDGLFFD